MIPNYQTSQIVRKCRIISNIEYFTNIRCISNRLSTTYRYISDIVSDIYLYIDINISTIYRYISDIFSSTCVTNANNCFLSKNKIQLFKIVIK